MDRFVSEPTDTEPEIDFDSGTGKMKIAGNFLVDHPNIYFADAYNWLEIHLPAFPDPIQIDINLRSVSSRGFLEVTRIVKLVEKLVMHGKKIEICWHHSEKDEEMKEKGLMLNAMTQLEVQLSR